MDGQLEKNRNCYCSLWKTNPDALKQAGIPHGFCGFCSICGKPGHTRHAPGIAPYTDAWCDSCYKRVFIRNITQAASLVAIPITLITKTWYLAVIALGIFLITTYFVKHNKL